MSATVRASGGGFLTLCLVLVAILGWGAPPAVLAAPSAQAAPAAPAAATAPALDMLPVLGGLVLILLGARLGGALSESLGQPPVLGELAAGVVLGNLGLLGWHGLDGLRALPVMEALAQIGVLFLLFQVGLESSLPTMVAVGPSSFLVAAFGVVAPMVLGFGVSRWWFPAHNPLADWFVGATLCATSVGITARVLSDLKRAADVEGRIILGAAVIDDVLGLMVLAVVVGIIQAADRGAAFHAAAVASVIAQAVLFLVAAVVAGRWLSRHAFRLLARLWGGGTLLSLALAFCFGAAFLAGKAGLAPIVGAFAAGLVLEEVHYADLKGRDPAGRGIPELLPPIAGFLVPIFFVLMGMRVDLRVFGAADVLGFATVLTLAAVLGKQACSLGVLERGADRLAVGLGMIPRGEVGLVFASVGAALTIAGQRVIADEVYSAVVLMVAATTLVTPPLLAWRLGRSRSPRPRGQPGTTA